MQVRDSTDDLVIRGSAAERPAPVSVLPGPRVEYRHLNGSALPHGMLALVRFGSEFPALAGAFSIDVSLNALESTAPAELWWARGPVTSGRAGNIRFASDDDSLFGVIELDEREFDGLCATAESGYREILQFQTQCGFPHLLRMWNYLDAINEPNGDLERYRHFCLGRARGFADLRASYPAASGIGRQRRTHLLQIFWLASRTPAQIIENPRQVSAYRYPPEHGPASPSFSRAAMSADGTLFVSGTASIVGHASRHHSDPLAQLEETVRNLQALNALGGDEVLLKVYVRDAAHLKPIRQHLRTLTSSPALFLQADICRRELLLEIECVRQARAGSASTAT